jgi:hypothetical protein
VAFRRFHRFSLHFGAAADGFGVEGGSRVVHDADCNIGVVGALGFRLLGSKAGTGGCGKDQGDDIFGSHDFLLLFGGWAAPIDEASLYIVASAKKTNNGNEPFLNPK